MTKALFSLVLLVSLVGTARAQAPDDPVFPDVSAGEWDIQLSELDLDPLPTSTVIEIDGFEATDDDVAALHTAGKTVICYINAGAWEEWRPDADQYPEAIIGNEYPGWPGERFVDIRALAALRPILEARLDMCAAKGFDAVDPDNVDTFGADTGFELSADDQLRFNRWLASGAHVRGLAIGQKNVPELAADLAAEFDFAVTEDCLVDGWCAAMQPYADAGKPVLMIEYTDRDLTNDELCALARDTFGQVVIKHRDLDAWSAHCP